MYPLVEYLNTVELFYANKVVCALNKIYLALIILTLSLLFTHNYRVNRVKQKFDGISDFSRANNVRKLGFLFFPLFFLSLFSRSTYFISSE